MYQEYRFENVMGHYEIYDDCGSFAFSADTLEEAFEELREMARGIGETAS